MVREQRVISKEIVFNEVTGSTVQNFKNQPRPPGDPSTKEVHWNRLNEDIQNKDL